MSAPRPDSPDPTPAIATAVAAGAGLAAFEIAGLAARDGLFLSELSASQLPAVMLAAAGVSLAATLGLSHWMRVSRPERVAPLALLLSAAVIAGIGAAIDRAPGAAAVGLYLQVTGIGPVVASAFWSVVNERFDPYRAKQVVARMAAAGALGGVAGGALAERLATWAGLPALLFVLAGIACACAWATRRIGAPPDAAPESTGGAQRAESGLVVLRRIALLRQMALLMLIVAVVETLVEYALKVEAARSFQSDEALVRFFAVFYASCGLLAFAIQSFVGDRFLRRFGLAGAVAMLPGSVALLGFPGTLVAKLWTVTLARGAETVASTAFFRTGFQLLYTPMATGVKRPAKVWVDVAAGSAGDMIGAGLVLGLLFAQPDLPTQFIVVAAVVGSLAALAIVQRIHGGYVSELSESLRRGRVEIRAEDALDKTTLQTIVQSQTSLGRRTLLERVRAYDADQGVEDAAAVAVSRPPPAPEARARPSTADPTPGWVEVLASEDPASIRSALVAGIEASQGANPARRRRVISFVLPLLGDDRVAREARNFLRPMASRSIGQLTDTLLDADQPLAVRTRVAWILGGVDDERAVEGLWRACSNESFPVRLTSARALARIVTRSPTLSLTAEQVHPVVENELDVDAATWAQQRAPGDEALGEGSVLLSRRALREIPASLEHLFTLLAITHDREQIASALAGLASRDASLSGTALELLESLLPPALRRKLWPRLDVSAPQPHGSRSQQQIADELRGSTAELVIDRDALRRSS